MTEEECPRHDLVQSDAIASECLAAAGICSRWAEVAPEPGTNTPPEWRRRLRLVREAVISGQGRREPAPHEIVQTELRSAARLIEHIRYKGLDPGDLDQLELPCAIWAPGLPQHAIRPLPWSQEVLTWFKERFVDARCSEESRARRIVQFRLGMAPSTVRDAEGKESRKNYTQEQQLGISLYIDLCISYPTVTDYHVRERLLDALQQSGLSPITIFYLAQIASTLPRQQIRLPTMATFQVVCEALTWTKPGQFELLAAKRLQMRFRRSEEVSN